MTGVHGSCCEGLCFGVLFPGMNPMLDEMPWHPPAPMDASPSLLWCSSSTEFCLACSGPKNIKEHIFSFSLLFFPFASFPSQAQMQATGFRNGVKIDYFIINASMGLAWHKKSVVQEKDYKSRFMQNKKFDEIPWHVLLILNLIFLDS